MMLQMEPVTVSYPVFRLIKNIRWPAVLVAVAESSPAIHIKIKVFLRISLWIR